MIKKGTLVKYIGADTKALWHGRYLSVAERDGDTAEVYVRGRGGKWETVPVRVGDLVEVC